MGNSLFRMRNIFFDRRLGGVLESGAQGKTRNPHENANRQTNDDADNIMALINCLECGKQISTKAAFCPNCGAPPSVEEVIQATTVANEMAPSTILKNIPDSSVDAVQKKIVTQAPVIKSWKYIKDEIYNGPVDDKEMQELIRLSVIQRDTLVWTEGMPTYGQADSTELAGYIADETPPPIPQMEQEPLYAPVSNTVCNPDLCILNLFLPGITQMIFGQMGKGLSIFFGMIFLLILSGLVLDISVRNADASFFATLIIFGYIAGSITDAYMVGSRLAERQPVRRFAFFPRKMPPSKNIAAY